MIKRFNIKTWFMPALVVVFIGGLLGVRGKTEKVEAYPGSNLRRMVDETCGACHNNMHVRAPGDYSLDSGALAKTPGVLATSLGIADPTAFAAGSTDPLTALIIQKPMDGSVMPHGGIKISSTTAVMQALIDWVNNGAPAVDMNRAAQPAVAYRAGVGAGEHEIVYSRRTYRRQGFNSLTNYMAGGDLYRMRFTHDVSTTTPNPITPGQHVNLTGGVCSDVQNPTVSLDGTMVAFACKQGGQPWQIWEIGIDGTGARAITSGPGNKIQPVYLPYLPDGTEAGDGSGGVAYLSDVVGFRDEYDQGATLALFVCDTNGNNTRQIDFNPSHGLHPTLHSSGMLIFTRWQHNEHQGHNFMPLHQMSISDYATAGTNLFGAYGEHGSLGPSGTNSLHESAEMIDPADAAQAGYMIARGSGRDDDGGSIVGPFLPKLVGSVAAPPTTNVIMRGENVNRRGEMGMMAYMSSVTFREPTSLLEDLFVVSVATLTHVTEEFNTFTMTTETTRHFGHFALQTFTLSASSQQVLTQTPLLEVAGMTVDEAVPVLVRPMPPKIGKPVDLTKFTGTFTSGNVTDRQNDNQPRGFTVDDVSVVRFIRSLQLSQGRIDTGKRRGISTQIVGEATISSDGSFSALVPANVPMQFQLIDKNGRVLVNHKPWIHVAPGATERCVGCHATHNQAPAVQTLEARQLPSQNIEARRVTQFHFHQDIQPILNENCISCHDSANVQGASGYNPNRAGSQAISLVGRFTPANVTESYQTLTGISRDRSNSALVRTQNSRGSPLMHWLTGSLLTATPPTPFPNPAALVDHSQMLDEDELDKIARWIDTGTNFRVVEDNTANALQALSTSTYANVIWPIMEGRGCATCHGDGGAGQNAMDLSEGDAEDEEEAMEMRMEALAEQMNFMIPEASPLLRKPLGEALGGVSHVGGQIWTGVNDPDYLSIYQWIATSNPQLNPAAAPNVSDLTNVENYPNPFRDTTQFVYRLNGVVATKVDLEIYSVNGKLVRELSGSTMTGGATMGWNSIPWDGKDKNGKVVSNDVYFFVLKAEFGDGAKKKIRGKCVKVN